MKTLLITGATGFLGGCLASKYLEEGYRLRIIARNLRGLPLKEKMG
ncbi:NAD-dependent epimerase/dehydratase family protein [Candidatus Kuenenia stuttgartensis]|nr:NAD-dependent epimerase/dehydratase family protein [Candidatus Kuenenia stuttgartiensis]